MRKLIVTNLDVKYVEIPQDYLAIMCANYFYQATKSQAFESFNSIDSYYEYCYDFLIESIKNIDSNIYLCGAFSSIHNMIYFNYLIKTTKFTFVKVVLGKKEDIELNNISRSEEHPFIRLAGYFTECGNFEAFKNYAIKNNIDCETIILP